MKKAANAKKKMLEKMENAKEKEKAKLKEKILKMRKLAASNYKAQISTFKALLPDPSTASNLHSHPIKCILITPSSLPSSITLVAATYLACQIGLKAKKFVSKSLA